MDLQIQFSFILIPKWNGFGHTISEATQGTPGFTGKPPFQVLVPVITGLGTLHLRVTDKPMTTALEVWHIQKPGRGRAGSRFKFSCLRIDRVASDVSGARVCKRRGRTERAPSRSSQNEK